VKGVLGCEFNRFDEINILTNFRTNSINIYKSSNDDDVSILLYDFIGKLLYQEVITDNGNNLSETISFETIFSSTYFINVQIGGHLKTQKIIINKHKKFIFYVYL
jgi:hypothetical protein